jgi:phage tail sheath protein FI
MPAALYYPGFYIEEMLSGIRTIIGVATAIAAFVGRTDDGPCDDPVLTSAASAVLRSRPQSATRSTTSTPMAAVRHPASPSIPANVVEAPIPGVDPGAYLICIRIGGADRIDACGVYAAPMMVLS